ncbi:MAG: sensor histidine kinase [Candidatus Woesearchaeota archaeon]|jgi:signal transduction histidine kinase
MDKTTKLNDNFSIEINSSVVFRLGQELITDDGQALLELIKNSYDADASYSSLFIETEKTTSQVLNKHPDLKECNSFYPKSKGVIIVEDDGSGMTKKEIQGGFLTISASPKEQMKIRGETTNLGRTPLGDKGLGRLGIQRLGVNVDIYTFPEDSSEKCFHVGFSWNDFKNNILLSSIIPQYEEISRIKAKGTYLLISGLNNTEYIKNNRSELINKIYSLISPYKEQSNFLFTLTINGENIDLFEITENILDVADIKYTLDFNDKGIFEIKGKIKLDFLKSSRDQETIDFVKKYMSKDEGNEFRDFLIKENKAKTYNVIKSKDPNYYLEIDKKYVLEDMDKLALINKKPASPGPFKGNIYYFDLNRTYTELSTSHNIFNSRHEFMKTMNVLSGIKVFRNGFGIKVPYDWLNLSQQQTSGKSWYGLRPGNTMGYIALSAKDNSSLKETTNREGFIETAYYINFYKILQQFIDYSEDLHAFIRKEALTKFKKSKIGEEVSKDLQEKTTPDKVLKDIINLKNKPYKGWDGKNVEDKTAELSGKINNIAKDLIDVDLPSKGIITRLFLIRDELQKQENSVKIENQSISKKAEFVKTELDSLREQLPMLLETSSLGITVEALIHEINNIIDRLYDKTKEANNEFKKNYPKNSDVFAYTEHVKSTLNTIRKQLTHITPSLRYLREQKEIINLDEFWNEEIKYYKLRFVQKNIDIKLNISKNFSIKINRGKLFQIVDNIVLNSEYWLQENMATKAITAAEIMIEIDRPYIRIWDTGKGIDSSVENSLFEPFITCKRGGRGLGLFIISQFLDAENCSIELLDEKNKFGRRYKFEIDFGRILND